MRSKAVILNVNFHRKIPRPFLIIIINYFNIIQFKAAPAPREKLLSEKRQNKVKKPSKNNFFMLGVTAVWLGDLSGPLLIK